MIQDVTDQQIKAIQAQFPLAGKTVLEIGCGKGRVTRDLARYALRVIASDPAAGAIESARNNVSAENIEWRHSPDGIPKLPQQSVDLVIYTLSLHHVPADDMQTSLQQASELIKADGAILVLEPGDGGSFNQAKARFGVGSGDEGPLKAAALAALDRLPGWTVNDKLAFTSEFMFRDKTDFYTCKLPHYKQLPLKKQQEIEFFLQAHRTDDGLILTSERRLYRLQRGPGTKNGTDRLLINSAAPPFQT